MNDLDFIKKIVLFEFLRLATRILSPSLSQTSTRPCQGDSYMFLKIYLVSLLSLFFFICVLHEMINVLDTPRHILKMIQCLLSDSRKNVYKQTFKFIVAHSLNSNDVIIQYMVYYKSWRLSIYWYLQNCVLIQMFLMKVSIIY